VLHPIYVEGDTLFRRNARHVSLLPFRNKSVGEPGKIADKTCIKPLWPPDRPPQSSDIA
jgi:hypothetical protein